MRDRSKQLLVINTGKKESEQTRLPAQSGTTHIIGGGGLSVNMSDYLLKSIWDKVFEIRTDSQGTEYIFGKLPMVTQYGITMYSGDGVDVPSLASGLPFDGRTIWYNPDTQQIEVIGGTGGGGGEGVSNFWDLSGIPSWMTNTKPKYTYSEIEGTPDLTQYALVSQIPSLSGYATESWVLQKNYATKSTTLSGYGITDAYTKTNVDDLLKAYVTLGGTQSITGEKNFTGGLKVNGSPIYYDSAKKYWKLEGDLLVTGGVTMYGSDSSFTPSTIMDAIAVDGTTISKSGGVLKVIGGTGGGVADSVAWGNITGKPTWIGSSKPTYSYSEITGAISTTELQNYLTQNSYLNVTSGDNRYLMLSGGTISNNGYALILNRESENPVWIQFRMQNEFVGAIGGENGALRFMDKNSIVNTVWHSGNFNPSNYLPLSGGTIDSYFGAFSIKRNTSWASAIKFENTSGVLGYIGYNDDYTVQIWDKNQENSKYILHSGNYSSFALPISGGTIVGSTNPLTLRCQSGTFVQQLFQLGNNTVSGIGKTDTYTFLTNYVNGSIATEIHLHDDGNFTIYSNNVLNTIWHSGNDGSGSGLDADLLDGKNLSDIIRYEGLNNNGNAAASAQTITYWGEGNWGHGSTYGTSLNIQGAGSWNHRIDFRTDGILDYYQGINTGDMTHIGAIAFTSSNVASATKLQTARTIWGQSFDGTGDIEGAFRLIFPNIPGDAHVVHSALKYKENPYGLLTRIYNDGAVSLQVQRESNVNEVFTLLLNPHGGNVGIGTTNPKDKLDVNGNIIANEYHALTPSGGKYPKFRLISDQNSDSTWLQSANAAGTSASGSLTLSGMYGNDLALCKILGPLLVTHGITMYSDKRKKTIINHVELSLKQIADAPLIEHYYNSDEKKTTHVGSIAQYWASMNDWFCKLDSEGYYTMEIQNAALASAISIARELDRYETKTDKAIKKLKKRICELEEEVERLKSA